MPFKNSSAGYCISNSLLKSFVVFVRNAAHFIGLLSSEIPQNEIEFRRLIQILLRLTIFENKNEILNQTIKEILFVLFL
jgi:hypothetical protein